MNTTATSGRFDYRWVAMGVVLFGSFMVVLDSTVVNLGLPDIQRDFEVAEGIEWVVTAYLAAVGVAQTASGYLADRFGRKAVFVTAMAVFTLASLSCAAAPTFGFLIGARAVQGLAGGMMMPVAMAMIYELFEPNERGQALSYYGIAIMVAPAVGPVLSGTLVTSLSWRWLFLINIPIGVVGVPLAIRMLRDTGFRDEERPFDRLGLGLVGIGLVAFLIGVSQGGVVGYSTPIVIVLVVVGVILLAGFVMHSRRIRHPLVELDILTGPIFAIGMLTIAVMTVAQFSRLVYIPLELGALRRVSEIKIGLVMLPSAVGMALTMPIGGRLVDRVGARIPVTIGVSILALSFVGLWQVDLNTPLVWIALILFAGGIGSGFSMMSPNIVAMNSVETHRVSQASGLSNVSRQVAAAVGVAALSSVFESIRPDSDTATKAEQLRPYHTIFLVAVGLLIVALCIAQFLPGKERSLELQRARAMERVDLGEGPPPDVAEVF